MLYNIDKDAIILQHMHYSYKEQEQNIIKES